MLYLSTPKGGQIRQATREQLEAQGLRVGKLGVWDGRVCVYLWFGSTAARATYLRQQMRIKDAHQRFGTPNR